MYFLRRISLFTVLTLAVVSPRFSFATDAVVPSKAYVDDTFEVKSNKLNGTNTAGQKIGDLTAGSGAGQDQVMYPSAAAVKQYVTSQLSSGGTSNSGYEEKANKVTSIASNEESNTTKYTSNAAVTGFAQKKPTTVANGQVLTYIGNDANANVSAGYIKLPVAAGAPSTNTPTSFVEVWIQ